MNANKHKALMILSFLALMAGLPMAASGTQADAVMLEIIDGETAFLLDEQAEKAWWVVGECRRPIPIETSGSSEKKSNNTMASKMISEDVRIGSRQVTLRQQFRFNMATLPASVDVYNSVRGGWSSVPVRVNTTCRQDSICRSRMELPEC